MDQLLNFGPYVLSAFIGIGLAAATGFRVFLPLFAVSLSTHLGWIAAGDNFMWLSGWPTLVATGVAMVAEIAAYYIPVVDHLLDTLSVPIATIAGSVLFASQFTEMGSFAQWSLALIAGGGTAAVISSGFAGTRAVSTATTGTLGNSAVATTETFGAGVMSFLALAAPVIAFVFAVLLLIAVVVLGKKLWRRLTRGRKGDSARTIEVEALDRKKIARK